MRDSVLPAVSGINWGSWTIFLVGKAGATVSINVY